MLKKKKNGKKLNTCRINNILLKKTNRSIMKSNNESENVSREMKMKILYKIYGMQQKHF